MDVTRNVSLGIRRSSYWCVCALKRTVTNEKKARALQPLGRPGTEMTTDAETADRVENEFGGDWKLGTCVFPPDGAGRLCIMRSSTL